MLVERLPSTNRRSQITKIKNETLAMIRNLGD